MELKVDLSKFENWLSTRNKIGRAMWVIVYVFLFRPALSAYLWPWRRFLLALFGARIHRLAHVHADAKIWAPWNLEMGPYTCLASGVNVYNTGNIIIGQHTTISQGAYLCPGSHDITDPKFRMICSEMQIGDQVWIATEAFIGGLGVHIGDGAVVGARAVVTKNVPPWKVVAGNPAKEIKDRVIRRRDV